MVRHLLTVLKGMIFLKSAQKALRRAHKPVNKFWSDKSQVDKDVSDQILDQR